MDKPQVENLERRPPVEPLPLAIKTEAGVLLNVEAGGESALRLAKDGHVCGLLAVFQPAKYMCC